MVEWSEVKAAIARGRGVPVRGRVTAHRHSKFGIGYAAGRPVMLVSLRPEGLDLVRSEGHLRLDRVDGAPHFISAGGRAWDFAQDPECPVTTQSRFTRLIGPGDELVTASDAVRERIEQCFPSGPVREGNRVGRPVWVIPGTVDSVAAELTVDQDTGVVLAVVAVDGDWSAEFTSIEFPETISPELFRWDGESTKAPPVEFLDREDGTWTADAAASPAPAELCNGRRVYPVRIAQWLIGDGSIAPPRIGDTVQWPLSFATGTDGRPRVESAGVTVLAEATPAGDGDPRADWSGTVRWATHLQGDGWCAAWDADRPVIGTVSVRGTLWVDALGQAAFPAQQLPTRGRVCRIQIKVQRQHKVRTPLRTNWETIPDAARWIDVQSCPRPFGAPEFSKVLPDGTREYPDDVLVHLDLDSAEPPTPRPRLVAGSSAVSGHTLWVADAQLPLVARLNLDRRGGAVQTILPLPVAASRRSSQTRLSVHPDETGCWVLTHHDRYRIELEDDAAASGPEPLGTWTACGYDGHSMLLLGEDPALIDRDGHRRLLELPKWDSSPVIAHRRDSDPYFVLALPKPGVPMRPNGYGGATARYVYRVVTISDAGETTVGPDVEFAGHVDALGIVNEQIWVAAQGAIHILADDLSFQTVQHLPSRMLEAGFVGDRMWILTHHPDGTGPSGWWPYRNGETRLSRDDGRLLFALLDLPSLEPEGQMAVDSNYLHVTQDDNGTVWVPGREIRGLHTDGTVTRLDIAHFLDEDGE